MKAKGVSGPKGAMPGRDKLLYLIFGILTTLVNYGVYFVCRMAFGIDVIILNTSIAWLAAVVFAFLTNRIWVFGSEATGLAGIVSEFIRFIFSRIATGFLDVGFMQVFSGWLGFQDLIMKVVSNIIVIIANYGASKYWVFGRVKNK